MAPPEIRAIYVDSPASGLKVLPARGRPTLDAQGPIYRRLSFAVTDA